MIATNARAICDGSDRDEWLRARTQGIGASESACLLGIEGAWGSPLAIWRSKIEPETVDREDSERFEIGHALEETILALGAKRAGVGTRVSPNRRLYAHGNIPYLLATPDGIGLDSLGWFCVEAKNVSEWAGKSWDDIPEKYICQCQHQMAVLGFGRCLFVALVGGRRIVWRWVEADANYQSRIVAACSDLWGHVLCKDPPPAREGDTTAELATMTHEGDAGEVDAAAELDAWLEAKGQEQRLDKELKAAKAKREAAAANLAAKLGSSSSGTVGSYQIAWTTTERKGYTVQPSTVRTFGVKEIKQ